MGNESQGISDAEREVLKVLWGRPKATVREIRENLAENGKAWAHTTVNTLLTRLEQKGCVNCDRTGFAHVFSAAVSRDQLIEQRISNLADEFCEGTRLPLMLALVDGQTFSEDEIQQFRALIDQLDKKKPREKRTKKRGRG